eukprot:2420-Heterococcus_DN1.PRE.1
MFLSALYPPGAAIAAVAAGGSAFGLFSSSSNSGAAGGRGGGFTAATSGSGSGDPVGSPSVPSYSTVSSPRSQMSCSDTSWAHTPPTPTSSQRGGGSGSGSSGHTAVYGYSSSSNNYRHSGGTSSTGAIAVANSSSATTVRRPQFPPGMRLEVPLPRGRGEKPPFLAASPSPTASIMSAGRCGGGLSLAEQLYSPRSAFTPRSTGSYSNASTPTR